MATRSSIVVPLMWEPARCAQAEDRATGRIHGPLVRRDTRGRDADFESGLPNGCHAQGVAAPLGTRPVDHSAITPIRPMEILRLVLALMTLAVGLGGTAVLILRAASVPGPWMNW